VGAAGHRRDPVLHHHDRQHRCPTDRRSRRATASAEVRSYERRHPDPARAHRRRRRRAPQPPRRHRPRPRRERRSQAMSVVLFVTVLAAITPLFLLLWQVPSEAGRRSAGSSSPRSSRCPSARPAAATSHGIVGTLYMTAIATLMSVPLGLLAAVYLNERPDARYATRRPVLHRRHDRCPVDLRRPGRLRAAGQRQRRAGARVRDARRRDRAVDHHAADRRAVLRGDAPPGPRTTCASPPTGSVHASGRRPSR
jgi:hypothetical protein